MSTSRSSPLKPLISTQEIEALLPQRLFMRVHRSFIIALNKIESYTNEFLEVGGVSVPVGRTYKDSIEKLCK